MRLNDIITAAIQTKHGLRFNPDSAFVRRLQLELEQRDMVPGDIEQADPPDAISDVLKTTFLSDRLTVLNKMNWRGILTVQTSIGEMTFRYDTYAEWEQAVNAAAIANLMLGTAPAAPTSAPAAPSPAPSAAPAPAAPLPENVVKFTPQRLVCQFSEKAGKYWRLYGADFYKDYGAPIYPEVLETLLPDHADKQAGFVLKFNGEFKAEAEVAVVDGKKKVKRVLRVWKG